MTDNKILNLSYWLIPEDKHAKILSAIIDRLSTTYKTYSFEPHITLCCGLSTLTQAKAALAPIATHQYNICASTKTVNYSMVLSKTLYMEFEETATLSDLANTIIHKKSIRTEYVFKPHLSLLYKRTNKEALDALSKCISIPLLEVCFNKIRVIHTITSTRFFLLPSNSP